MLVPDMMPSTVVEAFIFLSAVVPKSELVCRFQQAKSLLARVAPTGSRQGLKAPSYARGPPDGSVLLSMKALCVHAHYDDFEFVAAGTFELWRRKLGVDFRGRVLVCTDGKAGHHFRTREETGELRLREQEASARIGGYEFELLRLLQTGFARGLAVGEPQQLELANGFPERG